MIPQWRLVTSRYKLLTELLEETCKVVRYIIWFNTNHSTNDQYKLKKEKALRILYNV